MPVTRPLEVSVIVNTDFTDFTLASEDANWSNWKILVVGGGGVLKQWGGWDGRQECDQEDLTDVMWLYDFKILFLQREGDCAMCIWYKMDGN